MEDIITIIVVGLIVITALVGVTIYELDKADKLHQIQLIKINGTYYQKEVNKEKYEI